MAQWQYSVLGLMLGRTICLDQCAWIELIDTYYGQKKSRNHENLLLIIKGLSEEKKALFPLSLERLVETIACQNPVKRHRSAEFMFRLCKGMTIGPYDNQLLKKECYNFVIDLFHLDRKKHIFPDTIMHCGALGFYDADAVLDVVPKNGFKCVPDDQKESIVKEINEYADSPEFFIKALSDTFDNASLNSSFQKFKKEFVERHDYKRKMSSLVEQRDEQVKINRISWDDIRIQYQKNIFFEDVFPMICDYIIQFNLGVDKLDFPESRYPCWDDFFANVSSVFVRLNLMDERDRQRNRIDDLNDLHDVSFLSYSIPYGSVVVTDKKWAAISRHLGYEDRFKTKIFSIGELIASGGEDLEQCLS